MFFFFFLVFSAGLKLFIKKIYILCISLRFSPVLLFIIQCEKLRENLQRKISNFVSKNEEEKIDRVWDEMCNEVLGRSQ